MLCCRKKQCSKKIGSVRAFREVRKPNRKPQKPTEPAQAAPAPKQPPQDLGSVLFGGPSSPPSSQANPFSTSQASGTANPFSGLPPASSLAAIPPQKPVNDTEPPVESFAEKLRISPGEANKTQAQEPWPERSAFPAPFKQYYLDADKEELEPENPKEPTSGSSQKQYDIDDSGSTSLDKDTFESSHDKTFQKFSDRIAQNPEQVLRYELMGQPLLYSGHDDVATRFAVPFGKAGAARGIPRCESCGSSRVFELQLVPGLIYELEKDEAMDLEEGMEWGTIIVGTCANNCGEAGAVSFKEEWVGVQWEERVPKNS